MIQENRSGLVPCFNLGFCPFSPHVIWRALALALLISLFPDAASVSAATIRPARPSTTSPQSISNCVDLLVNGSFENAGQEWTRMAGSSLFSYATHTFVSGRQSLLLGFADSFNAAAIFAVEQPVILPAESYNIELSFYYNVQVEGATSSGDQATLTVYDGAGNQIVATQTIPPSTSGLWDTGRFDLTPLAGTTIRIAFAVENDGEPGRLAMYIDDVSLVACLPPSAQPPTPPQLTPAQTQTVPLAPQVIPLFPQSSPQAPAQASPQIGTIQSLDQCSCAGSLYTCSNFSSWSIAQACYTHCQVTAGFDIHRLDEDGNGIACELELRDVAPLTATATSNITTTGALTPSATLTSADAVTNSTSPTSAATTGSLTILSPVATHTTTNSVTNTVTNTTVGSATITATNTNSAITATEIVSPAVSPPAESLVPAEVETEANSADLVFSVPATLLEVVVLLGVGLLSLWVAYLAGQRRQRTKKN